MWMLLLLTLLLVGQAAYAQDGTQTANLEIDGMV
jgi:hypothetical protein